MNRMNFLDAISDLYYRHPEFKEQIPQVFEAVLMKRDYIPETLVDCRNKIIHSYSVKNPFRDQFNPNLKQIFDDYINTAKKELTMDQYTQFLRQLSLLLTGQISPELFIKLFLQMLEQKRNRENYLVRMLPLFLSSITLGVFHDASAEFYQALDNIAAEIVVYSTTKPISNDAEKSLAKCFKLLSNGTISPQVAKKWLTNYCPPEMIKKLDLLDNYTLFHPANYPTYLFSNSDADADIVSDALNVFQEFQQTQTQNFSARTLNPVTVDVLESKMKASRKIIGKLAQGIRVKAHELNYIYGRKSHDVSLMLPENYPKVMLRVSQIFEQDRNMLVSLLVAKMKQHSMNDIERRVLFKRLLNQNTLCFLYTIPGTRKIEFNDGNCIKLGLSVLELFIKTIFKEESNDIIEKIPIFSSLFQLKSINETKISDFYLIYALVFFKVLYDQLSESGDVSSVRLPIEEEQEPGSFGESVRKMVLNVRSDTAIQGDWPLTGADLVLVRIARFVARLSDDSLLPFPEGIDGGAVFTTVTPRGTDTGIILEVVSTISPCAVFLNKEQEDASESPDDPTYEE